MGFGGSSCVVCRHVFARVVAYKAEDLVLVRSSAQFGWSSAEELIRPPSSAIDSFSPRRWQLGLLEEAGYKSMDIPVLLSIKHSYLEKKTAFIDLSVAG